MKPSVIFFCLGSLSREGALKRRRRFRFGPGDHLFFGRMNAESLFASDEEAKRQTLVRL